MRICFLTHDYPPTHGGISRFAKELCEGLAKEHLVDVITTKQQDNKKDNRADNQMPIKETKKNIFVNHILPHSYLNPLSVLITVFKLRKIINTENYDKIIAFDCATTGLIGALSKANKEFIVFSHGGEALRMKRANKSWIVRFILKKADKIIANSISSKNILENIISSGKKKIEVVYPGVDTNILCYDEKGRTDLKRKYKLQKKKIILTLGRLDDRKGIDDVIKCLPKLFEKLPDTVYLIAGKGPMEKELRKLVQEKKINDKVIFIGYIPDYQLAAYYSLCDIFVMPSKETKEGNIEGFGMVLLEANACKRPVIGTNSGGISEAIIDGKTGFIIPAEDQDKLYNAMIKMLTDTKLAKKYGEEGEKRAKEEFSWNNVIKKFSDIIDD